MSRVALTSPLEKELGGPHPTSRARRGPPRIGSLRTTAGAAQGRTHLILSGRHRASTWRRRATVVAVLAALGFSILTVVIRALPLTNTFMLVIAVAAPYSVVVAMFGLVLAVLSRRVILSVVAVIVLAVSLGIQVRWYYGGSSSVSAASAGGDVQVRVLSSNLRYGRADPSAFVELARSSADVVTVTELTPEAVGRFHHAGINEEFPYSLLFPAPKASGNGIWSRHPLIPLSPTRFWNSSMVAARAQIPGVRSDVAVASIHVTSPMASFESWRNGIVATKSRLKGLADAVESGAVIASGDFNSTPDMRQFRDLLANGYRDGVVQSGAGYAPTFPSKGATPPLITIDHVLTRHANVHSLRSVSLPGSDHRALLATVGISPANARS
ncbi:endonuclease/exonuclease/phosphatase family protein [Mycobacterium sp. SMC-8]|uniref:endonuclease/exonuclease/phosphatase family protein n=1 Tax=Mycobacterium sp. SMC-8 TaxID=2857060 RepID=UPI0021B1972D|nr:endonuclease/exonuclease/phosphatase family protein [Mycobacterium sp. SMC-8]